MRASQTLQQIAEAADRLSYEHGFAATSFADKSRAPPFMDAQCPDQRGFDDGVEPTYRQDFFG